MKVLSLFDGMACGMLAFQKAGINIESYDAYEIDKYAIQTATHNFPNIKEHGDVFTADFTQYEDVDFIIGGSPCTYWSIAQKNNRETEASGMGWELFSQYVRAIKEAKPKYFIYENNKSMSATIRKSIDKTFGFESVFINSSLVSAQNRQRLYWVGKRNADGSYSKVEVEQPQDKGILLKDILESVAYRIPEYGGDNKARPLNAHYPNNCGGFEHRIWSDNPNKQQVDLIVEPIRVGALPRPNGELSTSQAFRIYDVNGKSVTLSAGGGGAGGKTGLYAIPYKYCNDKNMEHLMRPYGSKAKIVNDETEKAPTLLAAMGTGGGNGIYYAENVGNPKNPIPVYEVKDGFITIKGKQYPINLADGYYIIRKLTVLECKRLQTVPDWYEFPVSNAQAYKMLGNGWTINVIAHILKCITQQNDLKEKA